MGKLVYLKDGRSITLDGLPETRTVESDRHYGGLMDVSLHPLFNDNRLVYLAYVDRDFRMVVARFHFTDLTIQDFAVIFASNEFSLGSRIEWEDDSHFFVSQGMAGVPRPDPGPQDLNSDGGKIHRLMDDGSIPADNPVLAGQPGPTSIWSYGHRDPQGLYFDKTEGVLYAIEHGPLGGDELNIIVKGGNYGWPRFSYGLNYDGTAVGDLSEDEADSLTILPLKSWGPSFNMAPSGLERVTLPSMGPRLVWGSLAQQRLIAYDVASGLTSVILDDVGRVRDVTQLPRGDLVVLVDTESSIRTNAGRVVRLTLK
jgi:glucose/arabinose dehydrogenase